MIFRQLYDPTSSTYTYLLACEKTRQAILIDPVFEQVRRDLALLTELNLTLTAALDTHCHADHVTAAWALKQKTQCNIGSAAVTGAQHTDLSLNDKEIIEFGDQRVTVIATPGHTDGCLSFLSQDQLKIFTGDALLIRGCGRCDFQQGDARTLFQSVHNNIFTLPEACEVFPGHDYTGKTMSTVAEEKQFNARLGGDASIDDFVGYMNAMLLPHPKLIDYAVPANLKSGMPDNGLPFVEEDWAPVNLTFSGVPEVDVEWVALNRDSVTILDVREPEELELSEERIASSTTIPLSQLRDKLSDVPTEKPVVCLCRSGRRSAMAVDILKKSGVDRVANISGGMLRWKELA